MLVQTDHQSRRKQTHVITPTIYKNRIPMAWGFKHKKERKTNLQFTEEITECFMKICSKSLKLRDQQTE